LLISLACSYSARKVIASSCPFIRYSETCRYIACYDFVSCDSIKGVLFLFAINAKGACKQNVCEISIQLVLAAWPNDNIHTYFMNRQSGFESLQGIRKQVNYSNGNAN
jgi:hypothetical protein